MPSPRCRRSPRIRRRRALALGLSLVAGLAGGAAMPAVAAEPPPPLSAVADIDLARYLGRWHEVARLPNRFQRDCAGDVTADYEPTPNGLITVVNACREADGELSTAEGLAREAGDAGGARLEVTFLSLLGMPVWWAAGDYWVIGLDRDYRWAVVGTPDRDYGWILSRQPGLDAATLVYLSHLLAEKGYDPCAFVLSDTALAAQPARLCDL